MASSTPQDGSEDVSDFLRRIKELGDTTVGDDNDLEQEILESRKQREERRAERARSLSPDKQLSPSVRSPTATNASVMDRPILSPTRDLNSRPLSRSDEAPKDIERDNTNLPDPEASRTRAPPGPIPRSAPLSWQQRPTSVLGPRSRPISMISPTKATAEHASSGGDADNAPNRTSIANSLAQKDASWFRQTADRGIGSAALRKSVSDEELSSALEAPHRLHGMQAKGDQDKRTDVVQGKSSTTASSLVGALQSGDTQDSRQAAKAVLADDGHAEPPASPTKGVGGFVQSARLRRNESVNKRWSAQASGGRGAQNSPANFGTVGASSADEQATDADGTDAFANTRRSRSPTKLSSTDTPDAGRPERTPSHSPQKRWSPTKSSWLESALNKPPESPRSTRQTPSQPNWLSDLNKSRLAKMGKDESANSHSPSPSKASVDAKASFEEPSTVDRGASTPSLSSATKSKASGPVDTASSQASSRPGEEPKTTTAHNETSTSSNQNLITEKILPTEKSKPSTPPKKDFGSIKSNSRPNSTQSSQGTLEFQNAFGKLKRAQTQNYKAPDELKDNILRGKSGLAITGGPQKSERKDEFKDSLLRQKASMKEKTADPTSTPSRPTSNGHQQAVPEAIAQRKAMGRSESGSNIIIPTKPSSASTNQSASTAPKSVPSLKSSISEPTAAQPPAGLSGKLAARFNPALAGIIARGPQSTSKDSPAPSDPSGPGSDRTSASADTSDAQLDHMTKSRARGPKRRPPKTQANEPSPDLPAQTESPQPGNVKLSAHAARPQAAAVEGTTESEPPLGFDSPKTASKPATPSKPTTWTTATTQMTENSTSTLKSTPPKPSAQTKPISSTNETPTSPRITSKPQTRPFSSSQQGTGFTSIAKLGQKPVAGSVPVASGPKEQMRLPTRKDENASLEETKPGRSLPALESSRPKPPSKSSGLFSPPIPPVGATDPGAPQKPSEISSLKPRGEASAQTKDTPTNQQQVSPKSPTTDANHVFAGFFREAPTAPSTMMIDVSQILSSQDDRPDSDSRTVDHEMHVLGTDGKRTPLSASQQPILHETKMYLIKHVLKGTTGGQRSEVYLWTGAGVSASAVEDAQLFAKKFARESGGTLQTFSQGREPASFFQALGDIVITRRGDGSGEGPFLLCGRKHLGRAVVFDEVAFALSSFCSGFSFIVGGGKDGKIYLWKGSGCNADEIANAQMTSMNLSSSGMIVEISEGSESTEFLDLFPMPGGKNPTKAVPRSAGHWRLKSQHNSYGTRLFHVSYDESRESGRPDSGAGTSSAGSALWSLMGRGGSQADTSSMQAQRVREIRPYCQADLQRSEMYVLDAFFEIYVLVGPESQHNAGSLATALLFAQDYSILAAGAQDRPFVPVGTVVMQGAPRDLKACFRGWDDDHGLFGRVEEHATTGKSLRIVPLSAALTAIKRS